MMLSGLANKDCIPFVTLHHKCAYFGHVAIGRAMAQMCEQLTRRRVPREMGKAQCINTTPVDLKVSKLGVFSVSNKRTVGKSVMCFGPFVWPVTTTGPRDY